MSKTATNTNTAQYRAQRARYEATQALVKKHESEFRALHAAAKARLGVTDWDTKREQRERAQLAALAAKYGLPEVPKVASKATAGSTSK